MHKLGLLALALSASVLADAGTQSAEKTPSLFTSIDAAASARSSRLGKRDIELSKRVYFYKYLTEDYMSAITAPGAEASLSQAEVLMTLPVSFLNMGMDSYALSMISDPVLEERGGLGNSWFVLAQRSAERGDWEAAYDFASRAAESSALLDPASRQENRYILVSSLAGNDQLPMAKSVLDEMAADDRWYFYSLYNVMLAEMRRNIDSDDLARLLRPLRKLDITTAGYDQALYDRFMLTAGRYELENSRYPKAVEYLRTVSSDSPYAAPALLYYGWGMAKQWLYDQALQPWRVLQDNFYHLDLAVLESLMATPYVAELMQGGIESLHVYEYAERHMTSAMYDIDRLNDAELLSGWVNGWAGQGEHSHLQGNWLDGNPDLVEASETSKALESLLDTPEFGSAQADLLDIQKMQSWVQKQSEILQSQIGIMQSPRVMDAESGNATVADMRLKLVELKAEQAGFKRWVETEQNAPYPYANDEEMARLQTLRAIREETSSESDQTAEMVQLNRSSSTLIGIQAWKVFKEAPIRRWETVKAYAELGNQVNEASEKLDGLVQLESQLVRFDESSDKRLQKMKVALVKLSDLGSRLEDLRQRQQATVVVLAEHHLTMLNDRLKEYLATTRLAIARLYDNELRRNANSGGLGEYE